MLEIMIQIIALYCAYDLGKMIERKKLMKDKE